MQTRRKINNGTAVTLHSGLTVEVVNDRGHQISVKSPHPKWLGRIFFITYEDINPATIPPQEEQDELEIGR